MNATATAIAGHSNSGHSDRRLCKAERMQQQQQEQQAGKATADTARQAGR